MNTISIETSPLPVFNSRIVNSFVDGYKPSNLQRYLLFQLASHVKRGLYNTHPQTEQIIVPTELCNYVEVFR